MNRPPEEPLEGLDSPEDLDRRRVLERIRASLLGVEPEPVRVGRYVVGKRIGRGASGAVFVAHDGELDRDVALKVLRLDEQADPARLRDRLMREAQALARLSHPNVVQVYEAGRDGTRLFIAMELVEGESLERWQRAPRSWRELVAVYRLAGEGLSEAHRRSVVHKDFKPSNVMIRREPLRVCVTDFGVARLMKDEQAATQRDGEPPALDGPAATATVGFTPLYAAPEQLLGQHVDERSDQYAFCVALFEALFHELPFAGDDLRTLVRNKQAGHVVPFQRGDVPERIVQAIRRGIEADPARRHASMPALLGALELPRRRLVPAAGMVLAGLAAGATVWLGGSDPAIGPAAAPCTGYAEIAARHWNYAVRDGVRARFTSTGLPYAAEAAAAVSEDLDAHVKEWAEESTRACLVSHANDGARDGARRGASGEAGPAGRTPATEHARCLSARMRDVRLLAERLEHADATLVTRAYELVEGLPRIDDCAPREPLPSSIELARIDPLDEALAATHVALTLADWPAATRHAEDALAQATALGLEDDALEARIGLGRAQLELEGSRELGRVTLEAAAKQAEVRHDDRLAWIGWVHLAQLAFENPSLRSQAGLWLTRAEVAANRLGDEPRRQRLDFEQANLGLVEGRDAIAKVESVWRWLDAAGPRYDDLRIVAGTTLAALLLASPEAARAVPYAHAAMTLADERRGPSHPSTIMARLDLGMAMLHQCMLGEAEAELRLADVGAAALDDEHDRARILIARAQIGFYTGRPDEAAALLAEAEPLVHLDDPRLGAEVGPSLVIFRGVVAFAEDRLADAATHFEQAARMLDDAGSPAGAALARAMVGESRLYQGREGVAEAAALAEAARRELHDAPPGSLGIALKVAGLAALHDGRAAEAVEALQEAREQTVPCDQPELADIDLGLGVALTAVGRDEEAKERHKAAQAAFEALGPAGAARRARLEAFLAGPRRAG